MPKKVTAKDTACRQRQKRQLRGRYPRPSPLLRLGETLRLSSQGLFYVQEGESAVEVRPKQRRESWVGWFGGNADDEMVGRSSGVGHGSARRVEDPLQRSIKDANRALRRAEEAAFAGRLSDRSIRTASVCPPPRVGKRGCHRFSNRQIPRDQGQGLTSEGSKFRRTEI